MRQSHVENLIIGLIIASIRKKIKQKRRANRNNKKSGEGKTLFALSAPVFNRRNLFYLAFPRKKIARVPIPE